MNTEHRTFETALRNSRRDSLRDSPFGGPMRQIAAVGLALALMLAATMGAGPLAAAGLQGAGMGSRAIPTQAYFNHFGTLFDGNYNDAIAAFRNDLGSGIKSSQSRWIDSICYYTMIGEAFYRKGKLGNALDNYNAALNLYLAFPNWMQQVQIPSRHPGPRQRPRSALGP